MKRDRSRSKRKYRHSKVSRSRSRSKSKSHYSRSDSRERSRSKEHNLHKKSSEERRATIAKWTKEDEVKIKEKNGSNLQENHKEAIENKMIHDKSRGEEHNQEVKSANIAFSQ